jgi:hypothetical protein
MEKKIIIMNKQHKLTPQQQDILGGAEYEIVAVPPEGWTLDEMKEILKRLIVELEQGKKIVFVSPVPYLLATLSLWKGGHPKSPGKIAIFHNDRREKKELPDGKVVFSIPQEGWELVEIG